VDISPQLGGKVMASLGSANWKERNHTMDDIENIIRTAARIQSSIGDLIPGLKVRNPSLPPPPLSTTLLMMQLA
jgi:hypothetical protein